MQKKVETMNRANWTIIYLGRESQEIYKKSNGKKTGVWCSLGSACMLVAGIMRHGGNLWRVG